MAQGLPATTASRTGAVRLALAVVVPAEEMAPDKKKEMELPPVQLSHRELTEIARFLDPYYNYALAPSATVWVNIKLDSDSAEMQIDVPHRDPEEMTDLLETLYVVDGWAAVDDVVERVQRSLVAAVTKILKVPDDELLALATLVESDRPLYVPPHHVDLVGIAIGALLEIAYKKPWPGVISGLKAVVPVNGLFSKDTPHAETQADIAADPEAAARLFADAVVALSKARVEIKEYVLTALFRTEREAQRLVLSTLTDARASICRETIRYFAFTGEESAAGALRSLHSPAVTSKTKSRPQSEHTVTQPGALQQALKQLAPFARDALRIQEHEDKGGPTTRRMVEGALNQKRAILAREVGRHAQEFPVLSQIDVEDIEPASAAGPAVLGGIVFEPLKRAYEANTAMRARAKNFQPLATSTAARAQRHPEQAIARAIADIGKSETAWGYPKYIERAVSRVAGSGDDFTRKAVDDTLNALGLTTSEVATGMSQAAAEATVLGLSAHFVPRFVPTLNVAIAAWHIAVAVQKFEKQSEEFYCSLDPRDALIEAVPSTTGLIFDIATEAAFAFI